MPGSITKCCIHILRSSDGIVHRLQNSLLGDYSRLERIHGCYRIGSARLFNWSYRISYSCIPSCSTACVIVRAAGSSASVTRIAGCCVGNNQGDAVVLVYKLCAACAWQPVNLNRGELAGPLAVCIGDQRKYTAGRHIAVLKIHLQLSVCCYFSLNLKNIAGARNIQFQCTAGSLREISADGQFTVYVLHYGAVGIHDIAAAEGCS
ncbi:hypothetical protein D3C75_622070 [compost metagenome]